MILRSIIFCLLMATSLRAVDVPERPPVSLRFTLVSWGDAIPEIFYKTGGTLKKITVPSFAHSVPIQYTGSPELVFYTQQTSPPVTGADTETDSGSETKTKVGKIRPTEVGRVLLPADESRVTILLAPAGTNHYDCFAIPGDPTKFPYGQAKLVNISNQPLAIKCNRTTGVLLKPGESTVVPPNANSTLFLEIAAHKGDKWKRLLDNIFSLKENEQATVILSRGDYKFFLSSGGDMENEIHITVLRQTKESPASDKPGNS
jgi:hypothetical protein